MTRKRTSAAEAARTAGDGGQEIPIRVVLVTMDPHLASATDRARVALAREMPGISLTLHAAAEFAANPASLQRCLEDIQQAHIIIATMLFMEDHFQGVIAALRARRDDCDAIICAMCAGEVTRLTRLGGFDMDAAPSGPMALLRRLRGQKPGQQTGSAGARQMKMLRRLPKILRFIPGTAQDVRAYFLTLQYWLGGSDDNVANMVRLMIDRYANGPRRGLRGNTFAGSP